MKKIMGRLLEIAIYLIFGGLVFYKMLNDFISERLEATIKFVLYSLITVYFIFADIKANIIWIVLIGTVLFVPSMINKGHDVEQTDELSYAIEILLCSVNIFIILIKFGVMRIFLNL